jgi:hypothetical protein
VPHSLTASPWSVVNEAGARVERGVR